MFTVGLFRQKHDKMTNLVCDGDYVIIKLHDEKGVVLKINGEGSKKIGSHKISVRPIIGNPFSSLFEIQGRKLCLIPEYAHSEVLGIFSSQNHSSYL
jgi:hypothetical protein